MQIVSDKTEFKLKGASAVAIGKFDGIHAGHYRLIDEILRQKKNGLQAVIFTFFPSATVYFGGEEAKELTTREEKREIFERMGIDVLVEFPLNPETAATLPVDFVKNILLGMMNMKFLAAGEDVTFGKGGKGNRALLEEMAEENDFSVRKGNQFHLCPGRNLKRKYGTGIRASCEELFYRRHCRKRNASGTENGLSYRESLSAEGKADAALRGVLFGCLL